RNVVLAKLLQRTLIITAGGQEALNLRKVGRDVCRLALVTAAVAGPLRRQKRRKRRNAHECTEDQSAKGHVGPPCGHSPAAVGLMTAGDRLSTRPKIMRPAFVCSTLVTVMATSWPSACRPCSTTTIVPSSR